MINKIKSSLILFLIIFSNIVTTYASVGGGASSGSITGAAGDWGWNWVWADINKVSVYDSNGQLVKKAYVYATNDYIGDTVLPTGGFVGDFFTNHAGETTFTAETYLWKTNGGMNYPERRINDVVYCDPDASVICWSNMPILAAYVPNTLHHSYNRGLATGAVSYQFKDWAVVNNHLSAGFIELLELIMGSTYNGASTLNWFKTEANISGKTFVPFMTFENCELWLPTAAYGGKTGPGNYTFQNDLTWYAGTPTDLLSFASTYGIDDLSHTLSWVQTNKSTVSDPALLNLIDTYLPSKIKNNGSIYYCGLVTGWDDGGHTPDPLPPPPEEKPDTGETKDVILYEDELSYYYSCTNVKLGEKRHLHVNIDQGQMHPIYVCKKLTCSNTTSGPFTIILAHTTDGPDCMIPGTCEGDDPLGNGAGSKTFNLTLSEGSSPQVVLSDKTINQWFTGFRDKTKDLRLLYPGKNNMNTITTLNKYGITIGSEYKPANESVNHGQFSADIKIEYKAEIQGQTEACDKTCSGGCHCDGCDCDDE